MSRYEFNHGRYAFACGWDRPLQYFFLDVYDKEGSDEDEPIFDNLTLGKPGMSIGEIKEVCGKFGTDLPLDIESNMIRDQIEDLHEQGRSVDWIQQVAGKSIRHGTQMIPPPF